jgi:hypothetical protein
MRTALFWAVIGRYINIIRYMNIVRRYIDHMGTRGGAVVEALHYKPEGHGIDF